jgi:hypothetical protein
LKQPPLSPKVEEAPGASTLQEIFQRDYIPLQKDNAPSVKVPANGKYPLATTTIPPGVSVEGDMLGNITTLKFVDYDITDKKNFPELAYQAQEKYYSNHKRGKHDLRNQGY